MGEVYRQLNTAMNQEPVKENIPYSWASLACVKAHHYEALAHYFTATLLIDHQREAGQPGAPGFGQGCRVAGLLPLGDTELSKSFLLA